MAAVDHNLEFGIRPVSEDIERMLVREKLLAKLSSFFGALAAMLAGLGISGVMAYAVAGRTHEIGIRIAIGARRLSLLRAEMGSALRLVAVGIAIGLPGALGAGRLIEHQLFGLSAAEPAVMAVAAALLSLIATVATFVPARRATKVDAVVALRCE